MAAIRLAKLPDRTAIKLTISVLPELQQQLADYAAFYLAAYGAEEPVGELIPHMLVAFLDSDKAFARWRRDASGAKTIATIA